MLHWQTVDIQETHRLALTGNQTVAWEAVAASRVEVICVVVCVIICVDWHCVMVSTRLFRSLWWPVTGCKYSFSILWRIWCAQCALQGVMLLSSPDGLRLCLNVRIFVAVAVKSSMGHIFLNCILLVGSYIYFRKLTVCSLPRSFSYCCEGGRKDTQKFWLVFGKAYAVPAALGTAERLVTS